MPFAASVFTASRTAVRLTPKISPNSFSPGSIDPNDHYFNDYYNHHDYHNHHPRHEGAPEPVPDHASAPGPDPSVNSDLTLPLNLSSQVVVPAWPAFNRHPVRWRSSLLASGDVVDSKKTQ